MTIGQIAKQAGVNVQTIRFYERKGLLDEPPRRASGYRQYPEVSVARVRFIRRAKDLGFSLKEIHELLALRIDEESSAVEVKVRAEAKIADIALRISDLERMKEALAELTDCCRGSGAIADCPILEALEENHDDNTKP